MGFMGDLLGFGEDRGMNFRAQPANITNPLQPDQLQNAYGQTQGGLGQQQAFINALQGQNGLANQSSVFNQQQGLANQLQGVANGTGPNPAMAQLANTTGQNVANQAALMAGQRGSGANVGLLARQIGQQGAGIQQNAAGQGAALQAQQQLAAMNALQNQQGLMAGVAGQQVGQYGNALNAYNQFGQNNQGQLLNAHGNFNNANVANQGNVNTVNSGMAQQVAKGQQNILGGFLGAAGTSLGLPFNPGGGQALSAINPTSGAGDLTGPAASTAFANKGGMIGYAQGGQVDHGFVANYFKQCMDSGGQVKGKAQVSGDSIKNDHVPAMLSPGEVVIPRSVMQSQDPASNAAKFVQAILARNGMRK